MDDRKEESLLTHHFLRKRSWVNETLNSYLFSLNGPCTLFFSFPIDLETLNASHTGPRLRNQRAWDPPLSLLVLVILPMFLNVWVSFGCLTNCHTLGDLKQQKFNLSPIWRSSIQKSRSQQGMLHPGLLSLGSSNSYGCLHSMTGVASVPESSNVFLVPLGITVSSVDGQNLSRPHSSKESVIAFRSHLDQPG